MECLNEAALTRHRDHYHSRHCKACRYCNLTAAFPRPWVDKPGDPVDYFQDYTPHCLVCRYVNEWLFDKTLDEGEEHSFMECKENSDMASFNPNDPSIQAIRHRMVPGDQVRNLPQYPADDIKKGQKYAIALPRWISGDCGQPMYDIATATEDMKGEGGLVFRPYAFMYGAGHDLQCKGPLNEIHAQLAVKQIHDKMEKAIGNITSSCVARTRPIKSESRLLTTWQAEILEIMEANGVPEENIGKVLDLL